MTCILYLLIVTILFCVSTQLFILFTIQYEINSFKDYELPNCTVKTLPVSNLKAKVMLSEQRKQYNEYLKSFGKRYEKDELLKRFEIFKESLAEISRLNRLSGAIYGLTKFSDIHIEEILLGGYHKERLGECRMQNGTCTDWDLDTDLHLSKYNLEERFDWRKLGMVGPVLNQKKCNGCWAFGLVGAMESQSAIIYQQFGPSLSIQELIDCVNSSSGCNFGHVRKALEFLCTEKLAVVPEYVYPLKLFRQTCQIDPKKPSKGYRILKYWYLCSSLRNDEDDLLRLVHHGPVIVVVNAAVWKNYIDGVIQMECRRDVSKYEHIDHVVQIVGYDREPEDGSPPHYIVKNSWGVEFGAGGYVKLAIGDNICGVADEVAVLDVYYSDRII